MKTVLGDRSLGTQRCGKSEFWLERQRLHRKCDHAAGYEGDKGRGREVEADLDPEET